jgi:ribosomal protein S18 acetylase RimI-like enzyme
MAHMTAVANKKLTYRRPTNVHVRTATIDDHRWIRALARRCTESIGFLPDAATLEYIDRGAVLAADVEPDEQGAFFTFAGFVVFRATTGVLKVMQVAVDETFRGSGAASALVRAAMHIGRELGCHTISCWVRDDLKVAVRFWRSMGLRPIEHAPGGGRRGKTKTRYARRLRGPAAK